MKGMVLAVNISENKGTKKKNIGECEITTNGLLNDAHSGDWHRQVSLLDIKSIKKMKKLGLNLDYGDFAENITTKGLTLYKLPIGTRFYINSVILELTQIGKECHFDCAIKQQVGKCIMPKEGVFAKVIKPGKIKIGDKIIVKIPKD